MRIPRLSAKEYLILELLVRGGEMFGLQMVRIAPTRIRLGTVYVTLQRMEEKGFVSSRLVEDAAGGSPRRMFRATGMGYRMFTALQREGVPT